MHRRPAAILAADVIGYSRLMGEDEAGEICISSTVHLQVKNKFDLEFRDLGNQEVENLEYSVHVFSAALDGEPAPAFVDKSRRNGFP